MLPRRTLPLSAVSVVAVRAGGRAGAILPMRTLPLSAVSVVAVRAAGRAGVMLPRRTLPLSWVSAGESFTWRIDVSKAVSRTDIVPTILLMGEIRAARRKSFV